jgi:CubicO group peptidase (beta-lactamase class C family)
MNALHFVPLLVYVSLLSAPSVRAGDVVQGELGKNLDRHMTKLADDGFCGALLVARDGQIVISKGYGYAWIKNKVPFTPETVFDIGSITKQFTAAAIMRLEMDGKLSTDDKLSKYFDDVPSDKREITLHHLLTHSSGLVGELGDDYEVASREEVVRNMLAMKVSAPPGERFYYSNGGYSLLGAVVEIASGQPYETYLREQLWLPAGMRHTGYRLPDWPKAVVARGVLVYGLDWGTPIDKPWADDGPYWNLRANGGILSTTSDMYRWHQALLGEKILSSDAKAKMFTGYIAEPRSSRRPYGYGWFISTTPRGTELIEHGGSNTIFFADYQRFVDEDTVIILASSDSRHPAHQHEGDIANIVFPE